MLGKWCITRLHPQIRMGLDLCSEVVFLSVCDCTNPPHFYDSKFSPKEACSIKSAVQLFSPKYLLRTCLIVAASSTGKAFPSPTPKQTL